MTKWEQSRSVPSGTGVVFAARKRLAIFRNFHAKYSKDNLRAARIACFKIMTEPQESTDERPLNVASNASEEIGKLLSNFTERRFVLDGRNYLSVEGFYQGLKWPDKKKRAEIAKLTGPRAKGAGKGAPKSALFIYQGREYKFGGPEHHQLVKAAIRASLEQNPAIAEAFCLTYPRPIEHDTGREENQGTALPGSKFAQILEEIRREFIDAGK
jgi:predicted NAD-dependent protein-ADP-ribosyltransferase YbiA (DUF1768 family)